MKDIYPASPEWRVSRWFNSEAPLSLGALRGKVAMVSAFQMLCPGCVAQGLPQAQRIAQEWIRSGVGRVFPAGFDRAALEAINERESVQVASAFLSPPFLMGQFRFLRSKKKYAPAAMFLALRATHPAWSRLI